MKYFSFILIVAGSLLFMMLRCGTKTPTSAGTESAKPFPNQSSMTNLTVSIGDTIQILLPHDSSKDFTWYYEVSEDWIISMTEPYNYPSKSSGSTVEASPNNKLFLVKGIKKGTVNIRFYLIRPWEKQGSPAEEKFYTIIVTE